MRETYGDSETGINVNKNIRPGETFTCGIPRNKIDILNLL